MAEDKPKIALITGITGQDGSYLAELLLEKGYDVHGIVRRSSSFNTGRIEHLYHDRHESGVRFFLHYGDLADTSCLVSILAKVRPTEVYNLAAQSHVKVSFELSEYTANVDGLGTLRLLDAIRAVGLTDTCRFYQASTSELYGLVQETPQSEKTPFYPRSPYAVSKLFGYWMVVNYREAYNMFACNGILFNHESPRRGPTFVTRKITRAVVRIKKGTQKCLYLGNINAKRDWGHARDYVYAMWLMLQQDKPEDFVIGTGTTTSVRDFVVMAFKAADIDIVFEGEGSDEIGKNKETGEIIMRVDPKYYRPTEVDLLLSDPTKAKEKLGWTATTELAELCKEMVAADGAKLERELHGSIKCPP
mmetsp:Transcript_44608/g.112400  ORF Transcript_44608/g.112400 Transcript_44608/m.112400 type:complete len:361 (-) Transcript_44608:89-1171(-)